jgi:hypothetical protein
MTFATPLPRRWLALLATSAAVLVAACGGGGGASSDPPAPAGNLPAGAGDLAVTGTITGFGSVIVDGVKYDDSVTAVSVDQGASAPSTGSLSDLKLGMNVDAKISAGKLTDVVVRAKLEGPVGSVDLPNASFTVYGQTVKVVVTGATPTLFDGVTDLTSLNSGDRVEVHGTIDAANAITATRVERKPSTEAATGIRIGGVVTALDSSAKTFKFNDLTIDYSAATVTPSGKTPANGQIVVAVGDTPPAAGKFNAKTLRINGADNGDNFAIGGKIGSFTSRADFVVSGVHVDASNATIDGGTPADLAAGVNVGVEGKMNANVLVATKLRILKTPSDVAASLKGQVSDFIALSSFKLRETPVDASTATFSGGTSADLGNGASVIVTGKAQGDVFKADTVTFVNPPAAQPVKLAGELKSWDATAKTFRLMGTNVKLGTTVEFVGGALGDIANGKRIEASGTPDATGLVIATRVAFLGDLAPPKATVVGGRIVNVTNSSFALPGISVSYTDQTVLEGGVASDLANGVLVIAKGSVGRGGGSSSSGSNGTPPSLAADWILIVKADPNVPRIAGTIGGFKSISDFRIGEQKVDATNATVSGGTVADVANGSIVIVTGRLTDRSGSRAFVADTLRILVK